MEKFSDAQDTNKMGRILYIYSKLMDGAVIRKAELAECFGVNERSIQRDIEDIRTYMQNKMIQDGYQHSIIYDRTKKGYRLEKISLLKFTSGELLAISKILLDSRAFPKDEMKSVMEKIMLSGISSESQKMIRELISNELFHYVEPRHGINVTENLWEIGEAIRQKRYMEISYQRSQDKKLVIRKIKPLAIIFSEYYFYLTAFIDEKDEARNHFEVMDDSFPTIYRIDRIKEFRVLDEQFYVPYKDRFEEGEFRKRIQFMYGGKLQKVKFKYTGTDVDAILDRLPTAQIMEKEKDGYVISAEVFGKGIEMWLRSQGERVKIM